MFVIGTAMERWEARLSACGADCYGARCRTELSQQRRSSLVGAKESPQLPSSV